MGTRNGGYGLKLGFKPVTAHFELSIFTTWLAVLFCCCFLTGDGVQGLRVIGCEGN